jgi:hypothetical protein
MESLHPMAAATVAMAVTKVEHRSQLELYPFFHIFTDPMLSTQIRTGWSLHFSAAAATHTNGPTNSRADNFLLNFFPSSALTPQLIFLGHGT